jgi:hypothetical protein
MSHEQPTPSEAPKPGDAFGFTERERLTWRVSEERFRALLEDERAVIHSVELSANNYGEFLFVTLSLPEQADQPVGERASVVTFWGLGYHEYRERWITSEWFWYRAFSRPELLAQSVDRATTRQLLEERREDIRPDVGRTQQSERGKLFEMLADLTDEDGAYTEMQDLDDLYE